MRKLGPKLSTIPVPVLDIAGYSLVSYIHKYVYIYIRKYIHTHIHHLYGTYVGDHWFRCRKILAAAVGLW